MGNNKPVRIRESFDFNWKFYKGDICEASSVNFSDDTWGVMNVPHDWSVEGPFDKDNPAGGDGGYLPAGIGWYRKHFSVPGEAKDKGVFIEFDGIYMDSELWINGHYLGRHPYGYTSFQIDSTQYLNFGSKENIIAVRVDNSKQPNSRWYTGSGIYRHTWLTYTDKLHVDHWGTYVTTPKVSKESAVVRIKTRVNNENATAIDTVLLTRLLNKDNKEVGSIESGCVIQEGRVQEFTQEIIVDNPQLWSDKTPYLYKVCSSVRVENKIVDYYETPMGIREICFDADRGFLLNDDAVKLNGVCLHHDGGCVGAAVPERVLERRLEVLKEMGCNAIRMSHNPPAPEMLDMCDRMGFLVMDEAFDEWLHSKNKNGENDYGYSEFFKEHSEEDLISMLHRDRNHPSIVLWSVGNEIPEQTQSHGADMLKRLTDICHREDPTRMVTSACDNIVAEPAEATEEFLAALDVVGYNYAARWRKRAETYYGDDRHKYPERRIIGSENPSAGGVRGDYDLKTSRGGWWWGPYNTRMITAEQLWKFTKVHDYVSGDFMWTGIDYLGEARWPDKNASCGVIDMCGFPKDGYYFYQSQWTEKPMVHLFPHWNWKGSEGKVIPVICYTNCDSVELFLNGKSFGVKSYVFPRYGMTERYGHFDKPIIHPTTSDLHLSWDVPYEPGILKVVGTKDGEIVCEEVIVTSGTAAKIELMADREVIAANGSDACNITVKIKDENGNFVPDADNLITFEIEGEGRLIGVDNGKPDSHESFIVNFRRAFNGLCLAVIQATLQEGQIHIIVKSEGLETAKLSIKSEKF